MNKKTTFNSLNERKLSFDFWFSLFLFLFTVSAFSLRAMLDTENLPPMRLSLTLHAIGSTLWLAYVPLQSYLATKRLIRIHKPLGWISVGLAITILLSGIIISLEFFERVQATDPNFGRILFSFFFAGVVNFFLFSVFYTLGMLRLRNIAFHKRMMVFASLALVPPAFNRVVFAFDLPFFITNVGWPILVIIFLFLDYRREKQFHIASRVGLGLILLSYITGIIGTGIYTVITTR